MYHITGRWFRWLSIIAAIIFLGVLFAIAADICARFFFNTHIPGTSEYAALSMSFFSGFGLAYALYTKQHVRVSALLDVFPIKTRQVLNCICFTLLSVYFVLYAYAAGITFWDKFLIRERVSAVVYVPAWAGRGALAIGATAMAIQSILTLIECIRLTVKTFKSPGEEVEVI